MNEERRALWEELNAARWARSNAEARYEAALRAVELALMEAELDKSPLRQREDPTDAIL